jgi:DNA-binding winged helix-turn-helix (wHTH) protein/predicted ATPase
MGRTRPRPALAAGRPRRGAGPISLDPATGHLRRGGRTVLLRPKDLAVLLHLIEHRGRLVPKSELVSAVWSGVTVEEGVLKACVNRLRAALGDAVEAPRFIETVPRRGYRLVRPIALAGALGRLRRLGHARTSRIVGRDTELDELRRRFAAAAAGERQAVFVTAEAGLGKTTLVDAFLERDLPSEVRVARGQCIEQYGAGEAYRPVLEALGRLCRDRGGRKVVAQLARHAPAWLIQMPGLVSPAQRDALARHAAGATQDRMLRELSEALDVVTRTAPLIVVLEDLHWSDVSTLDLIGALARRREPARLLLVGTYRPEEAMPPGNAVASLVRELGVRNAATEIALPSLAEPAVESYLRARFPGASLPPALAGSVYRRIEGHPLFMVAMAEHWVARGMLVPVGDRWASRSALDALAHDVPADVRKMIDARVLRLPDDERHLIEAASVAGTEFSAASVAAALAAPPSEIDDRLAALADRGMMLRRHGDARWPDGSVAGRYGFSHALYRDVIYERVPGARRADMHGRVAVCEEAGHRPDVEPIAARLAMHFEEAGNSAGAVRYRLQAARNAVELGAFREAMTQASAGLVSLPRLAPGRARDAQELGLQLVQATALAMTRGYTTSDTERAYARVLALGREIGDTPESALKGVYLFHLMRGELEKAQDVAEQFLHKARSSGDTTLLGWAHMTIGLCLVHRGAITTARAHFDEGLVHYAARKDVAGLSAHQHDPGVLCHSFRAWCLWLHGEQAAAVRDDREALRLAETIGHPLTQAQALGCSVGLHFFRYDVRRAHDHVERNTTLTTEHGLTYWRLISMVGRGWARAMRGEQAAGLAELRGALDAFAAIGTALSHTLHLSMLAEVLEREGREDDAHEALEAASAVGRKTGERFWEAEIRRRTGELHLQRAERLSGAAQARALEEAATAFQQALAVARAQEARSLELRAAMSLCRLGRHTGDRARAQSTLAEVYGSFTEGFDLPDLKQARALIRETGGPAS